MIGILLLVIFLVLLGKALLETVWGLGLIALGVFWHIVGAILDVLIFLERRRKTAALCVLAGLAATAITYADTSDTPVTQKAATAANVMPIARTLTAADGRTIDVVITAKTATGIKAKKADGKEFELTLDKLSDADKAFVAGLVEPPVKRPRMLFLSSLGSEKKNQIKWDKLKAAGFDVQVERTGKHDGVIASLDKMSDDDLKAYDVIWSDLDPGPKRLSELLPSYNGVMVTKRLGSKHSRKTFLTREHLQIFGAKSYVNIDGNLILFFDCEAKWESKSGGREYGEIEPERIDEVIAAIKNLQQGDSQK